MIIVSVQLDSAIHESRDKELARVYISNHGATDGHDDGSHYDYYAVALRGRSTEQLDQNIPQRVAMVYDHPSEREHVLNLVAKALTELGYGKGPKLGQSRAAYKSPDLPPPEVS